MEESHESEAIVAIPEKDAVVSEEEEAIVAVPDEEGLSIDEELQLEEELEMEEVDGKDGFVGWFEMVCVF